MLHGLQVLLIARAIRQSHIEVPGLLVERKVVRGVERAGADGRVPGEDGRCTVPLMHIKIEDQDARDDPLLLKVTRGDGAIVEHAIASTVTREGVVCSAAKMHCQAVGGSHPARGNGSAHRSQRPLDERRRPEQTDAADLPFRQPPGLDRLDVLRCMNERQLHIRGRIGETQIDGGELN